MSPRCLIVAREIRILRPLDPDECDNVCPVDAIRISRDGVETDPSKCLVCIACMALCGPDRIRVVSDWVCSDDK